MWQQYPYRRKMDRERRGEGRVLSLTMMLWRMWETTGSSQRHLVHPQPLLQPLQWLQLGQHTQTHGVISITTHSQTLVVAINQLMSSGISPDVLSTTLHTLHMSKLYNKDWVFQLFSTIPTSAQCMFRIWLARSIGLIGTVPALYHSGKCSTQPTTSQT